MTQEKPGRQTVFTLLAVMVLALSFAMPASAQKYQSRWDKIDGPGGTWTTGWVPNHDAPQCGAHAPQSCSCGGSTSPCGMYGNGDTIVYAPYGCQRPERWVLQCTSIPQQ
ncbi:hypothetical protein ACSHT0_17270 [Tepidicaulis sp. LMO-SS28]|uniref:hypothetical protein n=1 Tax=Tepidicaulis sp. LMO-SS28 TaxID=3447455 RepID=UPI003EE1DA8A